MRTNSDKETGRVEAFSDGIYAFASTLLVLDLKVPVAAHLEAHGGLLAALGAEWPSYLAYVTSFLSILIMWMNHHKLFQIIHKSDRTLLVLNGLLMFGTTLVPFTTSLLSAYIERPEARIAAGVYSGVFVWIAVFYNVLWRYSITGQRLLHDGHDRHQVRKITQQYMYGPLMYLAAFLLSFWSAAACIAICLALAVFFALPESLFTRKPN